MVLHRIRQSSNAIGPSGLISMEDASVFHRVQIGNRTPGKAIFQKGVTDPSRLGFELRQNDESGNLPHWEYYSAAMRSEARRVGKACVGTCIYWGWPVN